MSLSTGRSFSIKRLVKSPLLKMGRVVIYWPVPSSRRITTSPTPGHYALDIGAAFGAPVVSASGGRVVGEQHAATGYGTAVRILDPRGLEEIYGHLSSEFVNIGDVIKPGEVIGRIGSTGYSSGPHLHFETRRPGPLNFARGWRSTTTAVNPFDLLGQSGGMTASRLPDMPPLQELQASLTPQLTPPAPVAPPVPFVMAPALTSGPVPQSVVQQAAPNDGGSKSPAFWQNPVESTLKQYGQRAGFIAVGSVLVIIGLIAFLWSYRDEIQATSARAQKAVGDIRGLAATVATKGAV